MCNPVHGRGSGVGFALHRASTGIKISLWHRAIRLSRPDPVPEWLTLPRILSIGTASLASGTGGSGLVECGGWGCAVSLIIASSWTRQEKLWSALNPVIVATIDRIQKRNPLINSEKLHKVHTLQGLIMAALAEHLG